MSPKNGRPPRRYARNKAEAARLGIPTWYAAKRSKEAAERTGVSQPVLRGHARPERGEVGLRDLNEALRSLVTPATTRPAAVERSIEPVLFAGVGDVVEVPVTSRRERSTVGTWWNAVRRYLNTGDDSALQALCRRRVLGRQLECDPAAIDQWAYEHPDQVHQGDELYVKAA